MPAVILRLLTLVALVLLPFGMRSASAAPAHHAPIAATAGHCDDQGNQPHEQTSDQAIDCAMACSMLATTEPGVAEPSPRPCLSLARPLAERGTGLHPDTATPPPKLSRDPLSTIQFSGDFPMSILISMALAAAQGQPAVQPVPAQPPAMHAQPSQPGAKPHGEGCSCCKDMAAGGKMECCAKHGEGHGGEHSEHSAHR